MVSKKRVSRKQQKTVIVTRAVRWPEDASDDDKRARINRTLIGKGYDPVTDWKPVRGRYVQAYVNHSRWIANCPEDCTGVEFVDSGWPRFVCSECGSGVWRVQFPKERLGIEAALLLRPEEHRNWTKGESVADLKAETAVMEGEADGLDST